MWIQIPTSSSGIIIPHGTTDINSTGNLLLIKTTPGNANGIASLIDSLRRPGILGTVAGDDTILVVIDSVENCLAVEQDFMALR
ncbi:hypothetical protein ACFL6R_06655 [Gemmatimonadota bacterium]